MRLRASELAGALGGRLHGPDVELHGVAIDSRAVHGGELFVPIVAERDGHDFVGAAVTGGAAAYLSARGPLDAAAPWIEVDDTARALLAVGREARRHLPDRVVGITGSVGKTTVKDLTAGALGARFRTWASARSFNNELGVPLTVANAPADTEALVVEMGARGPGHIALLCEIAAPAIGVVTVVAAAHTEMFGSLDEVARAKSELVAALPASGTAVLNAGDRRVLGMRRVTAAAVLTFAHDPAEGGSGAGSGADVTAAEVRVDDDLLASFRLHTPWGAVPVRLPVRGEHNVVNALAAAAAGLASGVPLEDVAAGLESATGSPSRMDLQRAPSGLVVVDDSYNSNPLSLEAGLRALARLPAGRRVAVLGVMAELGADGPAEHRRLAGLAATLGIEVLAVGTDNYGVPWTVPDAGGAVAALAALGPLGQGDAVLVKASRVADLGRVAEALLAG
ncbi:MAG TPA: UDP-N-acetylmuramoyl-tripeptide--D-alanyl-D-alanine ligase [Acidimicrobiales bacterium]|nr:UDP-N-acetylmuramoyl-tripeptide--D-alanyl-D-alanine ligase [Acidimicrobiales bacterium]